MLAKIEDALPKETFVGERSYDGYPFWLILRVKASREQQAAQRLTRHRAFCYLPTYARKVRARGHRHVHRQYAAIPGLLFMPDAVVDSITRREELFDLAGVYGFQTTTDGYCALLPKQDIELIRLLEAKLNLPPESKGHLFKVGQEVRFKEQSQWYSWKGGLVIELVDEVRITVEVPELFGRATPVTVPADEIEAM